MASERRGVVYVENGWQSLVSKLEQAATGSRRTHDDERTRHARCGCCRCDDRGSEGLDAENVDCRAAARSRAEKLVPELGPSRVPTVRAACFDIVLDTPATREWLVLGLSMSPVHYFSVHSQETALRLRYLAPHERGADFKDALEAWLDRVVPDLSAHVVAKRFLPEMEVASTFPVPVDLPTHSRVHFAGDWASTSHILLDAVAESADTVARRILDERERAAA